MPAKRTFGLVSTHTHINSFIKMRSRMDIKTKYRRLKELVVTHGLLLGALTVSASLGTILSHPEFPSHAHFLQRLNPPREEQPAPQRKVARAEDRRTDRLQKRWNSHVQNPVVRKNTMAQATTGRPYLVMEEMHQAALQEPSNTPAIVVQPQPVVHTAATEPPAPPQLAPIVEPVPVPEVTDFPPFTRAMHPVSRVPDWGAMKTPAEWDRNYNQMKETDYVRVPSYDMHTLTIPMNTLLKDRDNEESIKALTSKLYYSTRFFGAYDLDAHEYSGVHPGIDLKLPEGTPVSSIAGGRVHTVITDTKSLGLHVIIEHRLAEKTFYSIYGHLESVSVSEGNHVTPGQMIGTVGMTGFTSAPHLHLQVDRGEPDETSHEPYWPSTIPSKTEIDLHTINPIVFIRMYADGQ